MTVRYSSPSGVQESEVRVDALREAVLHRRSDYWSIGSCTGGLFRNSSEASEALVIMANDDAGFFLDYHSDARSFAAVSPTPEEGTVPVYPGGDEIRVPRKNFLQPELAWAAIEEFIRRPGLPSAVEWEDSYSLFET